MIKLKIPKRFKLPKKMMEKQFKIKNKPLFYTGLSFQLLPLVVAALWGLSMMDWTWLFHALDFVEKIFRIIFSTDKYRYYLIALFAILYEVASLLMIWAGQR